MSTPCTPMSETAKMLGDELPEPITDQSDLEDEAKSSKRRSSSMNELKLKPFKDPEGTDTELMSGGSGGEQDEDERRPKTPEIDLIPFQTSVITSTNDQGGSKSFKAKDDMDRLKGADIPDIPSEEEIMECEGEDVEDEPENIPEPVHLYFDDASGTVAISEKVQEKAGADKQGTDEEESSSSSDALEDDNNVYEEDFRLQEKVSLTEAITTTTARDIRRASLRPEQIDVEEVSEGEGTERKCARDLLSPVPRPAGEDLTDTEEMIAESDIDDESKDIAEHKLPEVKREIVRIKEVRPGEPEQIYIEEIDETKYMTDAEYKKETVPTDTEDFEDEEGEEVDEGITHIEQPELVLPECSLVETQETEKRARKPKQDQAQDSGTEQEDIDNTVSRVIPPKVNVKPRHMERETDIEELNPEKM